MRKTFTLFVLLTLCTCGIFAETSLWSGEKAMTWNDHESISADKFLQAEVADKIIFTFETTGNPSGWPQIALKDGTWKELPGCGNAQLSNGSTNYDITTYSYYITTAMLEKLQASGMVVSGNGYTLKGVALEKGSGSAGYENAIWIGNTDATAGWVAQTLPAGSFSNAKVGQYLRLYYTNLAAGAMHTIVNGSWTEIKGYDYYQMGGVYYQYTIDDVLLNEMQSNGIIINGTGYVLTHVDLIDPEALTTLTASVPVTDGWLFENTDPSITVNITNPYDKDVDTELQLIVKTDKQEPYTTISSKQTIKAGESQGVTMSFKAEPGFYSITPLLNNDNVYTASAISSGEKVSSFIIGVDPTKVVSAPDKQSDFDEFWSKTKQELAAVAPDYTLTELTAKSSSSRKVYLLEYKSLPDKDGNEAIARAYYAEPTAAGRYPTVIHYQGYDSGGYDPWCMNGSDNPGYCELILSTRGQLINNRSPYTNTYGDWFQYGFGNKDTYYYRGAYMDAVRAVDFLAGREKVDTTRIYAEGSSQGGALTYAAASLTNHPFAAIAPSIPFMGDFPDYFKVASWPGNVAKQQQAALKMTDEEMYAMLSYFDTKNLATTITCPVIETLGLQDNVCPPHTNMAPYNNLPEGVIKQISYNPLLMHTTPGTWWNTYFDFFKKYTTSNGISTVSSDLTDDSNAVYDLQGRHSSATTRGIYIIRGKKVVK